MVCPQVPDQGKFADARGKGEQVHFYPADSILLYIVDGKVQLRAEAWDRLGGRELLCEHDVATDAGVFVIDGFVPYRTGILPKLAFGTPIREGRLRAGEVEYQEAFGRWRPLAVVENHRNLTSKEVRTIYERTHGVSIGFPKTWFLDDFDLMAIRYFRDLDSALEVSDGYIHLRPIDRCSFSDAGALRQGMRLIVHSDSIRSHAPITAESVPAPSPARTTRARTWYEVLVIDQVGQPVSAVELCIEVNGDKRPAKTSADGRARLSNAPYGQATVSFADPSALLDLLDKSWAKDDTQDWIVPPDDAQVIEVTRLTADWRWPVAMSAESPKILILKPPYWLRLFDERGQLMPDLDCTVSVGSRQYRQTSDAQGWIDLPLGESCPESATVEWQQDELDRTIEARLQCHEGKIEDVALARLWNLGFQPLSEGDDGQRVAVAAFQSHSELADVHGELSDEVVKEIAKRWEERNG